MSKPLTVTIPHTLGAAEARRRLDRGIASLASDLPGGGEVRHAWRGDTLDFSADAMGQSLTGAMHVLADHVRLEIVLPGLLGMFAGKIRGKIEERGRLLLR